MTETVDLVGDGSLADPYRPDVSGEYAVKSVDYEADTVVIERL